MNPMAPFFNNAMRQDVRCKELILGMQLLKELEDRHTQLVSDQSCTHLAIRRRYGVSVVTAALSSLFSFLFEQWCFSQEDGDEDQEIDGVPINEVRQEVICLIQRVRLLGLFKMHHATLMDVLHKSIQGHIFRKCKDEYQRPFIPELKQWLQFTLVPFLEVSLPAVALQMANTSLTRSLLKALAETRAQELFNIVADFPDSKCAVLELKEAMASTETLGVVGKEFKSEVKRRLLHMGASTTQIVGFYVSMIRALRLIDSSDLLLNFVAAPVRLYLRDRKDTVRCVVSALTEKGRSSELHGELRRGGSLEYGPDEDDEDAGAGENWEPRKRNLDLVEAGGRGLDVLALLVSIYGSTDLFVSDYRSVLADKLLLSNLDYRADQELGTLELLKIRFGEEPMHCCEVMLRDLEESRRTNSTLLQSSNYSSANLSNASSSSEILVDCLIVSDNYWPALQSDPLSLPPQVSSAFASYKANYAAVKKTRKLVVAPQLGLVDIDLQFDDGTVRNFLVTPVQASLIMFLAEAGVFSGGNMIGMALSTLAGKCELEESDVQRRMGFWIAREVVREISVGTNNQSGEEVAYVIVEDQAHRGYTSASEGSDEIVQMRVGSDVTEKAALAHYETFVKGLLTQNPMTLERIHTMLRLTGGASGGGTRFDMNLVELQRFLQSLVDQDKLESSEGHFRIRAGNYR